MRRIGFENILSGSQGDSVSRKKGDREVTTSNEEHHAEDCQPTARKVGDHLEIESLDHPPNVLVQLRKLFSWL